MDMDNDIKIEIKIKDIKTLLANATVSINTIPLGFVTIKGFAIWKSNHFNERLQEAINITPPSTRGFKYIPIVFIENPKMWIELEQKIYDAFNTKRTHANSEEIDLDEVDDGIENMKQEENKNQ